MIGAARLFVLLFVTQHAAFEPRTGVETAASAVHRDIGLPAGVTVGAVSGNPDLQFEVLEDASSDLLREGEAILAGVRITREGEASPPFDPSFAPPFDGIEDGVGEDPEAGAAEDEIVLAGFFRGRPDLDATRVGVIRRGPLVAPDGQVLEPEAYVVGARRRGDDLVAPLHVSAGRRAEYLVVDHSRSIEWTMAPHLQADPIDSEPLGDRQPVILIHGRETGDQKDGEHSRYKVHVWDGIRGNPAYRTLFSRYKFYIYRYPTYFHARDCGEDLIAALDEEFGLERSADGRFILMAHSFGGLVSRWAMNTGDFGDKVGLLITGASPHHGAGGASLLYANGRIRSRVGAFWSVILRMATLVEPDTPGARSYTWDNLDGAITPEEQELFDIPINDELAELNLNDPHLDKVICFMGEVDGLWSHGPYFGALFELIRQGQATFNPAWGTSDPIVPLSSGLAEGLPVRMAIRRPGLDHNQLLKDADTSRGILTILRMHALHGPAFGD